VALAELDDNTIPIPVSDGRLDVRALDRDRSDRGWYGKLSYDGHTTKRLPVKLAPAVAPADLAGLAEARVEALLETQPQADGDLKPIRIHILAITDQRGG